MKTVLLVFALSIAPLRGFGQESCAPMYAGSDQIESGAFRDVFSVQKTIDVDLTVQLKKGVVERLKDDAVLEVRIFTPRGNLYQSISVPVSADAKKKGAKRKIDGYPWPVDVHLVNSVTRGKDTAFETAVRLPVAGTSIVRNSMYGLWSAEALLNGEDLKCAKRATFTITP